MPIDDLIQQLSLPELFHLAVESLVEASVYEQHQHLLEVVAPVHYLPFLELLRTGVELRACFGELDAFLLWQIQVPPALALLGLSFASLHEQVRLYLLEKEAEESGPWLANWLLDSAWPVGGPPQNSETGKPGP